MKNYKGYVRNWQSLTQKGITLATSRGLTSMAERKAAPAAENALSGNPNFPADVLLVGG